MYIVHTMKSTNVNIQSTGYARICLHLRLTAHFRWISICLYAHTIFPKFHIEYYNALGWFFFGM